MMKTMEKTSRDRNRPGPAAVTDGRRVVCVPAGEAELVVALTRLNREAARAGRAGDPPAGVATKLAEIVGPLSFRSDWWGNWATYESCLAGLTNTVMRARAAAAERRRPGRRVRVR